MFCDVCHKNQATVHFKQILGGEVTELHLCEKCADEKGIFSMGMAGHPEGYHFELADLLAGLAEIPESLTGRKPSLRCPNCKMTYDDFRKIGRFGCSECYQTFAENLSPLLKKIHGSSQYGGKFPQKAGKAAKTEVELDELKTRLQQAIQTEEFEQAAKVRDKIRGLERKNANRASQKCHP